MRAAPFFRRSRAVLGVERLGSSLPALPVSIGVAFAAAIPLFGRGVLILSAVLLWQLGCPCALGRTTGTSGRRVIWRFRPLPAAPR